MEEKFFIAEWRIENFSCWNGTLHGNHIESPTCDLLAFRIYPRGAGDGEDERMVVNVSFPLYFGYSGELSYIGPDGSVICYQQVLQNGEGWEHEFNHLFPPGPKLEEVVSIARKYKCEHKDHLTLRFKFRCRDNIEEKMCTVIDVFDTSLKIEPQSFGFCKEISLIDSYTGNGYERVILKLVREGNTTELQLIPLYFNRRPFSVLSFVSFLKSGNTLENYQAKERLFIDNTPEVIVHSFKMKEIIKEESTLLLRLKVISGKMSTKYCQKLYHSKGTSIVPNDWVWSSTEKLTKRLDAMNLGQAEDTVLTMLSKDLMSLYQHQDFSDFQLNCRDVSFPVHRAILSARSPVFKTMLSIDMREAASGCMDIVDLDPPTLGLFLTHLYTGAVDEMPGESALKLYYAADKYQVPSLKRECVNFLSVNVSVSNVCDILSLADKHKDDELTEVSHDFILNNFNKVLKSEKWKTFMKNEPLLAVATVTLFGEKEFLKKHDPQNGIFI